LHGWICELGTLFLCTTISTQNNQAARNIQYLDMAKNSGIHDGNQEMAVMVRKRFNINSSSEVFLGGGNINLPEFAIKVFANNIGSQSFLGLLFLFHNFSYLASF